MWFEVLFDRVWASERLGYPAAAASLLKKEDRSKSLDDALEKMESRHSHRAPCSDRHGTIGRPEVNANGKFHFLSFRTAASPSATSGRGQSELKLISWRRFRRWIVSSRSNSESCHS